MYDSPMNSPILAPNPFRTPRAGFNSLKLRALAAFEPRGWLNPPVWAVLVGFYPVRASYSYLLRLSRMRLLEQSWDMNGRITYRLSKRGEERLKWLRGSL